jgi:hypothetical protein
MDYYSWKSLDRERAQRALDEGGALFTLAISFGNGVARFRHGLQTKRGALYVVSDRTVAALTVPAAALPPEENPVDHPR